MSESNQHQEPPVLIEEVLLSASWQCPVCDQRGDLHRVKECLVAEAAHELVALREALAQERRRAIDAESHIIATKRRLGRRHDA